MPDRHSFVEQIPMISLANRSANDRITKNKERVGVEKRCHILFVRRANVQKPERDRRQNIISERFRHRIEVSDKSGPIAIEHVRFTLQNETRGRPSADERR